MLSTPLDFICPDLCLTWLINSQITLRSYNFDFNFNFISTKYLIASTGGDWKFKNNLVSLLLKSSVIVILDFTAVSPKKEIQIQKYFISFNSKQILMIPVKLILRGSHLYGLSFRHLFWSFNQQVQISVGTGSIFCWSGWVRSGQPSLVWVWVWKVSPKNPKFFNFFPLW